MENKNKKLVLLDAHAIIHRAYHALPDFATSRGEPTGALYGLVLMILKIATDLAPDYIVACYDLPKPTYRHEVYEGYKAGRAKTDDDLALQLEKSKKICEALNIPIYSKEGFEADDMLGTIVESLKNENIEIIIASGDMDTMQLINDKVKVYTLKKGIKDTILYDEKAIKERFGFEPKLLVDFKGLRGDPSDNIVGIKGVGEKSALDLIKNFGSIENIYKKLRAESPKLREKIKPRIVELLKEGEEEAKFSKMLATIRRDAPIDFQLPKKVWKEDVDIKKAGEIFKELEFRTMGEKLKNVLVNKRIDQPENFLKKTFPADLNELKIALWVVDSNFTNPTEEDIINFSGSGSLKEAKEKIFEEMKKREVEFVFEKIERPLISVIKKMEERGVLLNLNFLNDLNQKYSKELSQMEKKIWEKAGVEFNISSPKQLGEILFEKLGLSLKYQKKTSTGAKSTKESELQKMRDLHPIVPLILEYRELSKIISTYLDPISKMTDENNRLHAKFIQSGTTTGRISSQNPNLQNIPIGSERGKAIRKAFLAPNNFKLVAFDYSQVELRIAAFLSGDERLIEIFKSGEDVHSGVAAYVFGVPVDKVDKEMRRKAKIINFGILYGMGINALQGNLGTDRKTAQEFYNNYFEKFPKLANYLDKTKEEASKLGYTKTFFGRRRYFGDLKSKIPFIKASAERMAINAPIQGTSADIIKIAMKNVDEYIIKNKLENKVYLILQIHDELVYEISDDVNKKILDDIKVLMQSVIEPEKIYEVPIGVNVSVGPNWGEMEKFV